MCEREGDDFETGALDNKEGKSESSFVSCRYDRCTLMCFDDYKLIILRMMID
jgi:hypothetical protein